MKNLQNFKGPLQRLNLPVVFICLTLAGCSGFSKGITEAILEQEQEDTRKCSIYGRSFTGLEEYLASQGVSGQEDKILKVLMVHGIGTHQPGYSTELLENLLIAMQLPKMQEKVKNITLSNPIYPDQELGNLRISRHFNNTHDKEMLFYELTWDPIVEVEKRQIDFDNSHEMIYKRAALNSELKHFINDTVPDVVMYYGKDRDKIQSSVGQSLCWMLSDSWDTLPEGTAYCDPSSEGSLEQVNDDYVFITHSLGSRITADALQLISHYIKQQGLEKQAALLKMKSINLFMLSNQLPLLQLGQPNPDVYNQIEEICSAEAPQADKRLFQETKLIAFSDPNDLFSYAITNDFLEQKIDSRICPVLTNVLLNVAQVSSVMSITELANPMQAHTGYIKDERVIELLVKGLHSAPPSPMINDRCDWIETLPEGL